MRVVSIAVTCALIGLIGLTLIPVAGGYRGFEALIALAAALVVLVTIVVGWREPVAAPVERKVGDSAASAAAVRQAQAEVVGFLAVLQEKGRLVDFLTDDITRYSDAQVGAAARVVHQGCKAVLTEHFHIVPVREENEGSKVTVGAGYAADEYRLVGRISGRAPFSGTLMHRGWKTDAVNLPRMTRADPNVLPTIAPAEVELR